MSGPLLAALMFPALFLLVFCGIPIAFSLLVTAFLFGLPIYGDVIGLQMYAGITQTASQFLLSAVPPFVFMGFMFERSGIAERLFHALRMWFGRLPGGLALATMVMAAVIAASTGIVGAVEVVIGVMAIPAMLQYGYSRVLASGTVCAGGSLGTMIPPLHRGGHLRFGGEPLRRPVVRRCSAPRLDHGHAVLRLHTRALHRQAG